MADKANSAARDSRGKVGSSAPSAYDPVALAQKYPFLQPAGSHKGAAAIPLHRPITLVGSRRTARIHLNSARVSKAHALIVMTPTKAYVCDLLSRDATRVKGHAIKELELRDGDDLVIGDFSFEYHDPRPRTKAPPPAAEPLALQMDSPAGRKRIVLEKRVTLLGRRHGSDVELPFREVSTANTAIVRLEGFAGESDSMGFVGWAVFDLGGKGTILNDNPIHKSRIGAGDVLSIGPARIEIVSLLQEATEMAPVKAPAKPAKAVARAIIPAPETEVVRPEDLDEIRLDEDLTAAGMEEDLLGGSHVMDAISEPEAPPPADPATAMASFEELLDLPDDEAETPSQPAVSPPRPRPQEPEADFVTHAPEPEALDSAPPEPSDEWDSGLGLDEPIQEAAAEVDLSQLEFVDTPAEPGPAPALESEQPEFVEPAQAETSFAPPAAEEVVMPEELADAPAIAETETQGEPAPTFEEAGALQPASWQEDFVEEPFAHADFSAEVEPEPAVEAVIEPEPAAAAAEPQWSAEESEVAEVSLEAPPGTDLGQAIERPAEQELGVREGELDIREDELFDAPPLGETEAVLEATEPTPQSALDLESLSQDEELMAEEAPAPALSDSAFAMELEALTEEHALRDAAATDEPEDAPELDDTDEREESPAPETVPSAAASPVAPPRSERRPPWRVEQTAYLGNLTPLGSDRSFSPPVIPLRPVPAKGALVPRPEPATGVEHAPEGFDDEIDPAPGPGLESREAPQPQPPAPEEASPQDAATAATNEAPQKPRKVGFGGAVAEVPQAVAPGAANPFSSRPVGSAASPVPDPFDLALEDLEDIESKFPSARQPVARAPAAQERPAEQAPAIAEAEEPLDEDIWSRLPQAAVSPSPATNGSAGRNGHPAAPEAEDVARVDDFVRTMRDGLDAEPVTEAPFTEGNGRHAEMFEPMPAPQRHRPRGYVRGRPTGEAGGARGSRKRVLVLVPLLVALALAASLGAVWGIWYGMQPTVNVTMKLRYDIPQSLSNQQQIEYRQGQLDRLLDESLRLAAVEILQQTAPQVSADYLQNVAVYNKFALTGVWSDEEPNTMLLSRAVPASQRSAESARLRAVAIALFDRGGTERAAMQRYSGEVEQLEDELQKSLRQLDELTGQIDETVAGLPAPRDATSDVAQEQELEARIARLDEQWSSAGRRAVQLKEELSNLQDADPLEGDKQLADLRRRLADVVAQLASAGSDAPDITGTGALEAVPASAGQGRAVVAAQDMSFSAQVRPDRAAIAVRLAALATQAESAGAMLEAGTAARLQEQAGAFAGDIKLLVDETLPAQVKLGGEVEILRQALSHARRQRSDALLEADERVRSLRAEAAMKERELGAAVSDGLTERATGLRMALRMVRDRLSLRTDEVTAALEDDPKVVQARIAYETAQRDGRAALAGQREAFEQSLAGRRTAITELVPDSAAPLHQAMAEAESAARALIQDQTLRLPLLAEIWQIGATGGDEQGTEQNAPSEQKPAASRPAPEVQMTWFVQEFPADEPPAPATQSSLAEQAQKLRQQIEQREAELREQHKDQVAQVREQLTAAEASAAKSQREAQDARSQLAEMRTGQESAIRERQRVSQLRVDKVDLESAIAETHRELERARASSGVLATPRPPADVDLEVPVPASDERPRLIAIALTMIAVLTAVALSLALRGAGRA